MNSYQKKQNNGFALLLAVIISGVVLSIGLAILSIVVKQLNLGINTIGSEQAFQAAAAGMDCVRYLRNSQNDEFVLPDDTVSINCFGSGASMTDALSGSSGQNEFRQVFRTQFDWNTGVGTQCIGMEVYVLDATANARTYTPSGRPQMQCDQFNICTTAYVQGYNVACGDITGNSSAIVRELTAEF